MTGYARIIADATGVEDPRRLAEIEDIMRETIFHSTLDWQTREQLVEGAQQAHEVLKLLEATNV